MSRVAFVIPGLDRIGGAERQVLALAQGLAARRWTVTLIALSGSAKALQQQLAGSGVAFLSLHMRHGLADPRGWWRMIRWLRANRPGILHAHLPHATFLARWSRLLAPVPVVVDTVHTSATGPLARRLGYASSRRLTDCTTFVGRDAAEAWTRALAVSLRRSVVVPNGIDTDLWRPNPETGARVRTQFGVADEFVWLAAGRLSPVKNCPMLLRAFALLPTGAHLVIAGRGPMDGELRAEASTLGIHNRVHFLGFVDDLLPWMQAADGVALPSHVEGLPLVLLEAAACGVPAVATDVPGTREAILPGRTGFLCAANDAAQMAAAMQQVMQLSASQRAQIGSRARQRVLADFSLPKILDRWEALYGSLLAKQSATAFRSAPCGETGCPAPLLAPAESPSNLRGGD